MKLQEFFNTEFKTFSSLDNVRSIPSIIDGFKDSQRKAVYGMLMNGQNEIRLSQAAGKFALLTHYAHGENSMADAIVGLAQDYPGSNNVNLFEPLGQFGSILSSESSSHRYIFTKPSKNLREYIKAEDDCILENRYEDGDKAEPLNFYPILPMWIVNGSVGIGTGHSVKILPRDPKNVKKCLERLLKDTSPRADTIAKLLTPAFNGWTGEVLDGDSSGKYELHGKIEVVNTSTLRVTELPVGYGVDKFKSILVDLMDKGKVKDYDNNSTEQGFNFEIKVPREVAKLSIPDLKKLFKLVSRQSENITLWDTDGKLKQFETVYDALKQFLDFRLEKYETRRVTQLSIIENEIDFLYAKKLFIKEWNLLVNPNKTKMSDIEQLMIKRGVKEEYLPRLMSLRISSLTLEQIEELEDQIATKEKRRTHLNLTNANKMYVEDLSIV